MVCCFPPVLSVGLNKSTLHKNAAICFPNTPDNPVVLARQSSNLYYFQLGQILLVYKGNFSNLKQKQDFAHCMVRAAFIVLYNFIYYASEGFPPYIIPAI